MKFFALFLAAGCLFSQTPTSTIRVVGPASNGATPGGNPVQVAGWDGTLVRSIRTDSSGNLLVTLSSGSLASNIQGTQAEGAAATANPVRVGGWDGTNLLTLRTNSSGVVVNSVTNTGADGVANTALARLVTASGDGVLGVAPIVFNGATWDRLRGTPTGLFVQGNVTAGTLTTANPLLAGGVDVGGAARALLTSTAGRLSVEVNSGTIAVTQAVAADLNATVVGTVTANAGTGNFTVVQGTAANLNAQVVGTAANGAAASGNPVLVAGSDGTNARSLLTSSAGRLSVEVNSGNVTATVSGNVTVIQPTAGNLNATVVGTVTANAGTGNFTVVQGTASNLLSQVSQPTASNLNAQVQGAGASGAAVTGNPVLTAGSDGTNARTVLTDTSGRIISVGAAASGAAVAGNPVLTGASDGTNARSLRATTDGVLATTNGIASADGVANVVGYAAHLTGYAPQTTLPMLFNGTTLDRLRGSTTGLFAQGPAAAGSAVAGNPLLMGGSDGTNVRALAVSTAGRLSVDVNGGTLTVVGSGNFTVVQPTAANLNATVQGTVTANAGTGNFTVVQSTASGLNAQVFGGAANGAAVSGNPVLVAGSDGTNARSLATDASGRPVVVGAAASGAAVAGNPVLMGGSDGVNARSLLTSSAGRLSVEVNSGTITANAGSGTFTVGQATASNLNAQVFGGAASGAAVSGNPVLIGGTDGTNARSILTTAAGRLSVDINSGSVTATVSGNVTVVQPTGSNLNAVVTGTVTANAGTGNFSSNLTQVAGNPVVTGGISGALGVGGLAANAAAISGNPVLMGGSDGTNARNLLTDTAGRPNVVGAAASGAAVAGNPVFVAGRDSSGNVRAPLFTTGGALATVIAATPADAASNSAANPYTDTATNVPLQVFPSVFNGTTWDRLRGTTNGVFAQGAAAAGSAVAGNPVMMGLSDGTNARRVFGNSGGVLATLQNDGGLSDGMAFNRAARLVDSNGNGSIVGVAPTLFNGSTWDLQPGSAASGMRVGGRGSDSVGVNAPMPVCDQVAVFSVGASSTSAIVAASGSRRVRVCQVTFGASAAGTFRFISGTGTNCNTGTTNITGQIPIAINTIYQGGSGVGMIMQSVGGDALCIQTASSAAGEGYLTFAQY
jgi:hypothetical protein